MPQLDRIPTENSERHNSGGEEDEVEVICIDDSDDEDVADGGRPTQATQPPPLTRAPS